MGNGKVGTQLPQSGTVDPHLSSHNGSTLWLQEDLLNRERGWLGGGQTSGLQPSVQEQVLVTA